MTFERRPGETVAESLLPEQAGLVFTGRLRTPCAERGALDGIAAHGGQEVPCRRHLSCRDLPGQPPRHDGRVRGMPALRLPLRPDRTATSVVTPVARKGAVLRLDCLDGTRPLERAWRGAGA